MNSNSIQQQFLPTLKKRLEALAANQQENAGAILERWDQAELCAHITHAGQLACEVQLISVTDPRLAARTSDQLRQLADRLAGQLSYLEERLVVLEVDDDASLVQLRSQPPRVEGSSRSYFEVRVGSSGISLQRLTKQTKQPRHVIAATFTHDVLLRICGDLLVALDGNG